MGAVPNPSHELLNSLPDGRVQYVRDPDHNKWGVAIWTPGTVALLHRVSEGMDKNAAAWLAQAMIAARPDKFTGADELTDNEIASISGGIR